jgi:hypothetical protein
MLMIWPGLAVDAATDGAADSLAAALSVGAADAADGAVVAAAPPQALIASVATEASIAKRVKALVLIRLLLLSAFVTPSLPAVGPSFSSSLPALLHSIA